MCSTIIVEGFRAKKNPDSEISALIRKFLGKKNPGIELLSHTQMCSTIVARPLINRVRDGNVSFKPAIDTGKKYVIKIVVILLRMREEAKQLLTTRVEF